MEADSRRRARDGDLVLATGERQGVGPAEEVDVGAMRPAELELDVAPSAAVANGPSMPDRKRVRKGEVQRGHGGGSGNIKACSETWSWDAERSGSGISGASQW